MLKAGEVEWARPGGLAFSRDGALLALAGDAELYLWDTGTWRREDTAGLANARGVDTRSVAFLPDGGLVVGSASGAGVSDLRVISPAQGRRRVSLKLPLEKTLDSVAVSRAGSLIAAAANAYNSAEERPLAGEITVFDAAGRAVYKPALSGGPVFSVVFTPDGGSLVYKTYSWDPGARAYNLGSVVARNLASGSESVLLREKPGYGSGLFSYSPAGFLATSEGTEEVLYVKDLSGKKLATLNEEAYREEYRYMISSEGAFNGDGSLFAAQFTGKGKVYVRLFETAGWRLLKAFRLGSCQKGGLAGLAFSPDGKTLAAAQGSAFGSKVYIFSLRGLAPEKN